MAKTSGKDNERTGNTKSSMKNADEQPQGFICTQCGSNANAGFTNWKNLDGVQYVSKDERLCVSCFKLRTQDITLGL